MPKAHTKQQVSFLNGAIWQLPDSPEQQARDSAMAPELRGDPMVRSPNLYGDPYTTLTIYGYDVDEHAETAITEFLASQKVFDKNTVVTDEELQRNVGYWWPKGGTVEA